MPRVPESEQPSTSSADEDREVAEPEAPEATKPTRKKHRKGKRRTSDSAPDSAARREVAARLASAARRSLLKRAGILVVTAGVLVGALLFVRARSRPKPPGEWDAGDVVDVEITLVSADAKNLACAASEAVAGRHCAFETTTKPWSAGASDDNTTLRPYTTTHRAAMLAAGLWSQPALEGKLPTGRFSVKCKYAIEGKLMNPSIRWASAGPWLDQTKGWTSGVVSGCQLITNAGG